MSLYQSPAAALNRVRLQLSQDADELLKGRVMIVNHPELGRTPAVAEYFLLQRDGCERCLIGVHTDLEGRYEVWLGAGKYRIIDYDSVTREDLIRKGQVHEVNVKLLEL